MWIGTFLEDNMVYNEDCMLGMQALPDGCVDMVLCDLPYGTTQCKWDSVLPLESLWATYRRLLRVDGAIVLTCAQPFTTALIGSNLHDFKYVWIWEKTNCTGFANAKKQPLRSHEDIAVFYRRQPVYNPQNLTTLVKPRTKGMTGDFMGRTGFKEGYQQTVTGYPKSILSVPSVPTNTTQHPTQKPVDLFEYLIRTYTQPGQLVLDNCMGSGTTAVAAIRTGRRFIGFETDPKFFSIANERIAKELAAVVDPQPLTE